MTQAELAKFRRRIGDKLKSESDIITLSQSDSVFNLRFNNLGNVKVFVDSTEQLTGYTLDADAGIITFSSALPNGTELRVDYTYTAYTDAEIEALVETEGFDKAVVEVISELLSDSARLYDYSEGATDAKLSQVFDHLVKMLAIYQEKAEATEGGYTATDGTKLGKIRVSKRINEYYRTTRRPEKGDISRYDDL